MAELRLTDVAEIELLDFNKKEREKWCAVAICQSPIIRSHSGSGFESDVSHGV